MRICIIEVHVECPISQINIKLLSLMKKKTTLSLEIGDITCSDVPKKRWGSTITGNMVYTVFTPNMAPPLIMAPPLFLELQNVQFHISSHISSSYFLHLQHCYAENVLMVAQ